MEKHLLISKGCKGWGGPLTITPGQGKKIAYITGGIRPISANLRVEPSEECDASVPR